jgi:hypothetical protein
MLQLSEQISGWRAIVIEKEIQVGEILVKMTLRAHFDKKCRFLCFFPVFLFGKGKWKGDRKWAYKLKLEQNMDTPSQTFGHGESNPYLPLGTVLLAFQNRLKGHVPCIMPDLFSSRRSSPCSRSFGTSQQALAQIVRDGGTMPWILDFNTLGGSPKKKDQTRKHCKTRIWESSPTTSNHLLSPKSRGPYTTCPIPFRLTKFRVHLGVRKTGITVHRRCNRDRDWEIPIYPDQRHDMGPWCKQISTGPELLPRGYRTRYKGGFDARNSILADNSLKNLLSLVL